jgi:hypothetical protein
MDPLGQRHMLASSGQKKRRLRKETSRNYLAIHLLSKHGRRGRFPPHPMPNAHTLGALTGTLGRRLDRYKPQILYTNSQKNAKRRSVGLRFPRTVRFLLAYRDTRAVKPVMGCRGTGNADRLAVPHPGSRLHHAFPADGTRG